MEKRYSELCFNNALQELYSNGKIVGRSGVNRVATGLSSINNLLTIRDIIISKSPIRTLEIGLAYGGSALTILSTLNEIAADKKSNFKHTAIDPYQKEFDYCGIEVIKKAGLASNFEYIEKSSELALPNLYQLGDRYDLIYIDGSHVFEHVFIDLFYSTMLLNIGGIILFDDSMDPHVAKVINFLRKNMSTHLKQYKLNNHQYTKVLFKKFLNRLGYSQLKGFVKLKDFPRPWNVAFKEF